MKKKYFEEIKNAMTFLGKQKNTDFIGQAVEVPGTAMSNTLVNIDKKKIIRITCSRRNADGSNAWFSYEWLWSN